MMNTSEAKSRTSLSPGALMGHVEALKECLRTNTLFERLERRENLLVLRLDSLAWMKLLDREKVLINNGN
jgi:hypothetical protein